MIPSLGAPRRRKTNENICNYFAQRFDAITSCKWLTVGPSRCAPLIGPCAPRRKRHEMHGEFITCAFHCRCVIVHSAPACQMRRCTRSPRRGLISANAKTNGRGEVIAASMLNPNGPHWKRFRRPDRTMERAERTIHTKISFRIGILDLKQLIASIINGFALWPSLSRARAYCALR